MKVLIFLSLPLFLSASSSSSRQLSSQILEEVNQKFYSEPSRIISAHVELFGLFSFIEDLRPVLDSALVQNSQMTPFEVSKTVLEFLKLKLDELGQFHQPAGKRIYEIFVHHFSEQFMTSQERAASAGAFDFGFYGAMSGQIPFDSRINSLSAAGGSEYFDLDEMLPTRQPSSSSSLGMKQSSSMKSSSSSFNLATENSKKWKEALSKLDFLPARIFELALKPENVAFSEALFNATGIYDKIVLKFKDFASTSFPFSQDSILNLFNDELSNFIQEKLLEPVTDSTVIQRYAKVVIDMATEIFHEVDAQFSNDHVLNYAVPHESKRMKISEEPVSMANSTIAAAAAADVDEFGSDEEGEEEIDYVDILDQHELDLPENIAILDDPSALITATCRNKDKIQLAKIRGCYWSLIERDFAGISPALLEEVLDQFDRYIIGTFDETN